MSTSNVAGVPQKIKNLGLRWTRPRQEVIDVLSKHPKPVTIQEIFSKLDEKRTDLASVYRSIKLFLKHGVVVAVDSVHDGRRYELSDLYREHHHHVICQACGEVRDIEHCGLDELERAVAKRTGFQIIHHDLKFVGLCRSCQ